MRRWLKRLGVAAAGMPVVLLFPLAPAGAASAVASYVSHTGALGSIAGAGTVAEAVNTPDDNKFVQMDNGSAIVVAFPSGVNAEPGGSSAADLEIDIFDSIYPACADIAGSTDGVSFVSLHAGAPSHPGCPTGTGLVDTADIMIDLDAAGVGAVHFVKVTQAAYIDPAYPGLGFDLDGVIAHNTVAPPVVDDEDGDDPWLGGEGECPEGTAFAWKFEGLGEDEFGDDIPLHTVDTQTFVGMWAPGPDSPADEPTFTVTDWKDGDVEGTYEILSYDWTSPTYAVIAVYSKAGKTSSSVSPYSPGQYTGSETVDQGLSHVTLCFSGETDEGGATEQEIPDPTLAVSASGSHDLLHTWTIDKSADEELVVAPGGEPVDLGFTIDVTEGASSLTNITASGAVVVDNSAAGSVLTDLSGLSVSAGDTTCDIDDAAPTTVAAESTETVAFTCTLANVPGVDDLPDTISAELGEGISDSDALGFTKSDDLDDVPSITDSFNGGDAAPATEGPYTETATVPTEGCVDVTNTASVYGDDLAESLDTDSATTKLCPALEVTVAGDGVYFDKYSWVSLTKDGPDSGRVTISIPGFATISYHVTLTSQITTIYALTGTATIANPADIDQDVAGLDVEFGDTTCTLDDAAPTSVDAGASEPVDFTCTVDGDDVSGGSLTATLTDGDEGTGTVDAFDKLADVGAEHGITDCFNGCSGGTTPTTPAEDVDEDGLTDYSYSSVLTGVTNAGCETVTNTATMIQNEALTDSEDVEVCLQAGGHTIGFWQNKNGQAVIASQAADVNTISGTIPGLRSKLAAYGNVWAGGPALPANPGELGAWVIKVMKGASSTDAKVMFRAQFLATALSAHSNVMGVNFIGAGVPTMLPSGDACVTVGAQLSHGNTEVNFADRAATLLWKTRYDNLNNNRQAMCELP